MFRTSPAKDSKEPTTPEKKDAPSDASSAEPSSFGTLWATAPPPTLPVYTGSWPPPPYKYSKLFPPKNPNAKEPVPGVVMVHGMVNEAPVITKVANFMTSGRTELVLSWEYLASLAEEIAEQGVAVLMIGMRDDVDEVLMAEHDSLNEATKRTIRSFGGMRNATPAKQYARALMAGLDHLIYAAPRFHGVTIDQSRLGLVGHSLGAAGALLAAATDASVAGVGRIKAVVALNPVHTSLEAPFDHMDECRRYAGGERHSGEHGEGALRHLPKVRAATLLYSTLAEINAEIFPSTGIAPCWPLCSSLFEQLGVPNARKELYVDDNTFVSSAFAAHHWLADRAAMRSYARGWPLRVVLSFVRRHVLGTDEAPLERPPNSRAWVVPPSSSAKPKSLIQHVADATVFAADATVSAGGKAAAAVTTAATSAAAAVTTASSTAVAETAKAAKTAENALVRTGSQAVSLITERPVMVLQFEGSVRGEGIDSAAQKKVLPAGVYFFLIEGARPPLEPPRRARVRATTPSLSSAYPHTTCNP